MVLNVRSLGDVPHLTSLFAIVLWLPYLNSATPAPLLSGAGVDDSLRVSATSGQRPVARVDWRVPRRRFTSSTFIYLVRYSVYS